MSGHDAVKRFPSKAKRESEKVTSGKAWVDGYVVVGRA